MKTRKIGALALAFGLFIAILAFAGVLACWMTPHNALDPYETVWFCIFALGVGTATASFGLEMLISGCFLEETEG